MDGLSAWTLVWANYHAEHRTVPISCVLVSLSWTDLAVIVYGVHYIIMFLSPPKLRVSERVKSALPCSKGAVCWCACHSLVYQHVLFG